MESIRLSRRFIPEILEKHIIRSHVAIRSFNTRDPEEHIIEPSRNNPKFINVAIRLPGLTPSPAIAVYVVELLQIAGLELKAKPDFDPYRSDIPCFSEIPNKERQNLINGDPRYGRIICSCEKVTEGEIVESIKRGANTLSAIKYSTRAGMGRCQGNYCRSEIAEILAG